MSAGTVVCGVLGSFVPEDGDDECYGLYLKIHQRLVFVDIRKDRFLEERKAKAKELFAHSNELESSLERFLNDNPEFGSRELMYMGLHSENLDQAEVFWGPEGYTILKGLTFVLE